jgi:glycosyltransferase involved in cell wall biosynthesis
MEGAGRLVVAIPALNEQPTVGEVVTRVRDAVPHALVVVVDDGSTDGTGRSAQKAGAVVLTMPFNVGVGGAMRTAFLYAQQIGAEAVVQVDADGQHDPEDIPRLVAALTENSVVIGERFSGDGYRIAGPRRLAMRFLASVVSALVGTKLTDTTSGFRAADRSAIELFARHYPAEYLGDTVESVVLASRSGLRISGVPVTMRSRMHGEPRTGPIRSAMYLGRAVMAVVVLLISRGRDPREVGA